MPRLIGSAQIEFDGAVLRVEQGNATISLGGDIGQTHMGQGRVNGHSFSTEAGRLEITISVAKGESVKQYQGKEGTAVFRADTGQRYIITNGVLVENPSVKTNAGGNVNLVFEGDPAEEQV